MYIKNQERLILLSCYCKTFKYPLKTDSPVDEAHQRERFPHVSEKKDLENIFLTHNVRKQKIFITQNAVIFSHLLKLDVSGEVRVTSS